MIMVSQRPLVQQNLIELCLFLSEFMPNFVLALHPFCTLLGIQILCSYVNALLSRVLFFRFSF